MYYYYYYYYRSWIHVFTTNCAIMHDLHVNLVSILPMLKHCRKIQKRNQLKTNSWQECISTHRILSVHYLTQCPLQWPHQHKALPLMKRRWPIHASTPLKEHTEVCTPIPAHRQVKQLYVLGLVKLKPWEHVNLWEQSAPRRTCSLSEAQPRLFPASSVFYYPSPGTAPLYSRHLWERKAPEPRLIPPENTHPSWLTQAFSIFTQRAHALS